MLVTACDVPMAVPWLVPWLTPSATLVVAASVCACEVMWTLVEESMTALLMPSDTPIEPPSL